MLQTGFDKACIADSTLINEGKETAGDELVYEYGGVPGFLQAVYTAITAVHRGCGEWVLGECVRA